MPTAKILIVEDDPVQQKLYGLLCSRFGVEYKVFESSAEAFEFLNSTEALPDLLLIDCILNGESGLAAIKKLKEIAECRGRQLPVVAVTANAYDADRRNCLDSGADDYLSKPFTLNQFHDLIEHWCEPAASNQAGVA